MSERIRYVFQKSLGALRIELPLPPTDNHCHMSGRYSRYATAEYRAWLEICAPLLREALGDWQPDTIHWWNITGHLRLGVRRGDPQNYIKPCLDLLSGAHVPAKGEPIKKPGALWDDDNRVRIEEWEVTWLRHPEPGLTLFTRFASHHQTPQDRREVEKQQAREARELDRAARRPANRKAKVAA